MNILFLILFSTLIFAEPQGAQTAAQSGASILGSGLSMRRTFGEFAKHLTQQSARSAVSSTAVSTIHPSCVNPNCETGAEPLNGNESVVNVMAISSLKDCSCFGGEFSSNSAVEAQNLLNICKCYGTQKNSAGMFFYQQTLSAADKFLADQVKASTTRIQRDLGFFYQGSQIQASLLEGDSSSDLQKMYAPVKFDKDLEEKIAAASSEVQQTPAQNGQAFQEKLKLSMSTIATLRPKADYAVDLITEKSRVVNPEECLPIRHYMNLKHVQVMPSFYQDLTKMDPDSDAELANWDIKNLKTQVISLMNAQATSSYNPRIQLLKDKIKFLTVNPMYGSFLSSQNTDMTAKKKELLRNIKANYGHRPGCKRDGAECALDNSDAIRESDRRFFNDNVVKGVIQEKNQSDVDEYLKNPALLLGSGSMDIEASSQMSLLGDRRPTFNLRTMTPSDPLNTTSFAEDAIKQCATLAPYSLPEMQNRTFGDTQYDEFISGLRDELDPNPKNNKDYQDDQKFLCDTPRCRNKDQKGSYLLRCTDGITFKEYVEKRGGQKLCKNSEDWKCWSDKIADYLSEYNLTSETNGPKKFSLVSSYVDGKGLEYAAYLRQFSKQTSNGTSDPVAAAEILKESVVERAGAGTRFSQIDQGNSEQIRSVSRAQTNEYRSSAVGNSQSTASSFLVPQSSVSTSVVSNNGEVSTKDSMPVINSMGPQSFMNSVPVMTSALSPAQASAITKQIEDERNVSADAEAQASNLVSKRTEARPSERSQYDSQIAELSARADAASARADALSEQLKTAKAPSEISRSVASVPESSATEATRSQRTQVSGGQYAVNPNFSPVSSNQVNSSMQSFGSGSGSFSIPSPLGAKVGGSSSSSAGVNLNFKYGIDAKTAPAGASGAGIIVAGDSSRFDASSALAEAVNKGPEVNIGSVSQDVGQKLTEKDIPTISQFADVVRAKPGSIVRIVYNVAGQSPRELVVAKGSDGTLFFPAIRNLAVRRLEQLNAVMSLK